MTIIAASTPSTVIRYTLTDITSDTSLTESSSVGYTNVQYDHGTGLGEINMGILSTGALPSGGYRVYDFDCFPKSIFGGTFDLNFTSRALASVPISPSHGVKGIIITNTWAYPTGGLPSGFLASQMPYITAYASGTAGFSGLFGEGSGTVKIMPSSTWVYTDHVGITPHLGPLGGNLNNQVTLVDSGSGVPFEILVIGVTGTGST